MKEMMKKYWQDFKDGTKTMFKEFFNKETNKKQRANMWTFTRLIIPVVTLICSIFAIASASVPLFIATSVIAGFGALTDKMDGLSARKNNSYSEYGKTLDQITDKSFAGIIGINLLFLNFNYLFILLGELAIALVNIGYKLKHKNLDINSTKIGKIKQVPLFISLALGFLSTINPILFTISNISIIFSVVFQLATAASYIKSNQKNVKKLEILEYNNKLIEEIDDNEKNKNLEKTIGEKNNNSNTTSISKTQLYADLKNTLNQYIQNYDDQEKLDQKTKKLF